MERPPSTTSRLTTVASTQDALALSGRVWRCYDPVFGDHDTYEGWLESFFGRHAGREGFRLVVAVEADAVVGFGWGYVGRRGQYFTDLVTRALPPALAQTWAGDSFEVASLGVRADRRDAGLGRRLHDRLLAGVGRRCLLATSERPDNAATRFYERLGWRRLGSLGNGNQVMGREPTAEA